MGWQEQGPICSPQRREQLVGVPGEESPVYWGQVPYIQGRFPLESQEKHPRMLTRNCSGYQRA